MTSFFQEFVNFALERNVLDMAIGLIMGSALTRVVNSLVNQIMVPFLSLFMGRVDLSEEFIVLYNPSEETISTLAHAKTIGATTMNYGIFLNSFVEFLTMSFIIFLFLRGVSSIREQIRRSRQTRKLQIEKNISCALDARVEKLFGKFIEIWQSNLK